MDAATRRLILTKSLADYTCAGLNDFAQLTANEAEQIYTIVDIATV